MRQDFIDGIRQMIGAFAAAGLEAPQAVILNSHDEGMRLRAALEGDDGLLIVERGPAGHVKPVEHPDGSVWMEMTVMGVCVRWPANRVATSSGFRWA